MGRCVCSPSRRTKPGRVGDRATENPARARGPSREKGQRCDDGNQLTRTLVEDGTLPAADENAAPRKRSSKRPTAAAANHNGANDTRVGCNTRAAQGRAAYTAPHKGRRRDPEDDTR